MSIYENLPEFNEPKDLTDDEIAQFAEANIWPAATFFWGSGYSNPELLDENDSIGMEIESPGGEKKIQLGFYIEPEFSLDDRGELDEAEPADLYVGVALETYSPKLTKRLRNNSRKLEIWEILTYDFPLDGSAAIANRYYVMKDDEGDDVEADRIPIRYKNFLNKISDTPRLNLDRDVELNSQDILDIHNILLALEVPEGIISLVGNRNE